MIISARKTFGALAAIAILAITACSPRQSEDPTTTVVPATTPSTPSPRPEAAVVTARSAEMCFGEGVEPRADDAERVAELMNGRMLIGDHPAVPLPVDPTWLENDLGDASWAFGYQSLIWVDALRRNATTDTNGQMMVLYEDLLMDWWEDNRSNPLATTSATVGDDYRWFDMAIARRALVFLCAIPQLGAEQWILEALEAHGTLLAADDAYAGTGNHALHQNMSLAAVGYLYERPDWIDKASARTALLLAEAVDEQGISLEGSASYQLKNYLWWTDARERLELIGASLTPEWQRLDAMPEAISHLVGPDGKWIMLGDTLPAAIGRIGETPFDYALTRGAAGVEPSARSIALDAGYVIVRNSWVDNEDGSPINVLSLRHGPPMTQQVHGHEDLGSLTFYSGDNRLIDDGGIYGYFAGDIRRYMLSQPSHNVVTIEGADYYRSASGELTAFATEGNWAFANVSVGALAGARWNRTVVALIDDGIIIVDDRISQGEDREVDQRWHLAEGVTPVANQNAIQAIQDDDVLMTLVFLGGEPNLEISSGQRSSIYREVEDVPLVRSIATGAARFTTVIALEEIEAELVWRSTTGFRVVVTASDSEWSVSVNDAQTGEGLTINEMATGSG